MLLEGGEVHQNTVELERRHLVADGFLRVGRGVLDREPYLFEDGLMSGENDAM